MDPLITPADTCQVPGTFRNPVFHGDYSFNTGKIQQLTTADYVVMFVIFGFAILIAFYRAWQDRKLETVKEFLLAYRSMSGLPMGLSILANSTTGSTILGATAETYDYSTMFSWIGLALALVAVVTAHVFHPVFYRLNLITSHQYLEMRFSRSLRTISASFYIFKMLLFLSLVLYAPTAVLQKVIGLSLWNSVLYLGITCVVVTSLCGTRGIVWADMFIACIIFISLFTVLARAVQVIGSWDTVWEVSERSNRLLFNEVRLELRIRHSVWSLMIGGFLTYCSIFSTSQSVVHKTISCNTLRDAKIAVYIGILLYTVICLLCGLLGLYMGAFYENCDPQIVKLVKNSNQLLPLFVMDIVPHSYGLAGLFAASLIGGCMSTFASGLNAVTSCVLEDFIGNYALCNISVRQARLLAQNIVLLFGGICLLGTYVAAQFNNLLEATLALFGLTSAPIFGVFTLGILFPWSNAKGAMYGLCSSTALMVGLAITSTFSGFLDERAVRCTSNCDPIFFSNTSDSTQAVTGGVDLSLFRLSYLWYAPVAIMSCILVGLLVSYATGLQDPDDLDPDVYVWLFDEIYPFSFLPESFRKSVRPASKEKDPHVAYIRAPSGTLSIRMGTYSNTPSRRASVESIKSSSVDATDSCV